MKERHCCNCTGRERSVLIMFTCETCFGTFKRWSEYTRHLSAHKPELRSLCEHCEFTCNRKDSLKRHVERYHPFNDKILMSQLQETADVTVAAKKTTGGLSITPMEVDESTDFDLKLQLPNNFIYAGSTQSGKTTLLMKTLEHASEIYNPAPSKVVFLYGCWQDIYNKLRDSLKAQGIKIEFKQEGIVTKDDLEAMADPNGGQTMIVIDDNSITASENKDIVDAFTKARHNNCSIVLLMHFNFASQNFAKIRANSGYYFLLKSCENSQQVALLGIKMGIKSALVRAYEQEAKKPYGYVLLDRRPVTPQQYRIRRNIFEELLMKQSEEKEVPKQQHSLEDSEDQPSPPEIPANSEPLFKKPRVWLEWPSKPKRKRKTISKAVPKKKKKPKKMATEKAKINPFDQRRYLIPKPVMGKPSRLPWWG